jgi:hypothetical protein
MQIPPGFYFNSSYSITVWVYFTNTIVNNEMIFTFGNSQSDVIGLSVAIYNNPYFNYISNTNQQLDSFKTNSFWFSLQTWYHIGLTFNAIGNMGILYVNGNQVGSGVISAPSNSIKQFNYIGACTWIKPNAYIAYDDFKIYSGTLSSSQVVNGPTTSTTSTSTSTTSTSTTSTSTTSKSTSSTITSTSTTSTSSTASKSSSTPFSAFPNNYLGLF